jgi:hypothetical protein
MVAMLHSDRSKATMLHSRRPCTARTARLGTLLR